MRVLVLALAALTGQAFAASDRKFIQNAAACDRADAKLGQLAIEKGVDPQVKALGKKMVDDQAKMDAELLRLASAKNISLPKQMNEKDKKLYRKLSGYSGEKFDREFLQAMMDRQKKAIDAFDTQAGTGKDGDVRAWAAQSSMTLRAHRDLANDARQHL